MSEKLKALLNKIEQKLVADYRQCYKWASVHIALIILLLELIQEKAGDFIPHWAIGILSILIIVARVYNQTSGQSANVDTSN